MIKTCLHYDQFSKHGQPFLVNEPSLEQELMLPPEHIKWFSEQPDSTVSSEGIRDDDDYHYHLRIEQRA